jgi:hypothetical protein
MAFGSWPCVSRHSVCMFFPISGWALHVHRQFCTLCDLCIGSSEQRVAVTVLLQENITAAVANNGLQHCFAHKPELTSCVCGGACVRDGLVAAQTGRPSCFDAISSTRWGVAAPHAFGRRDGHQILLVVQGGPDKGVQVLGEGRRWFVRKREERRQASVHVGWGRWWIRRRRQQQQQQQLQTAKKPEEKPKGADDDEAVPSCALSTGGDNLMDTNIVDTRLVSSLSARLAHHCRRGCARMCWHFFHAEARPAHISHNAPLTLCGALVRCASPL